MEKYDEIEKLEKLRERGTFTEELKQEKQKSKTGIFKTFIYTILLGIAIAAALIFIGSALSNKEAADYGEAYARNHTSQY